ncbi:MAG: hypothetical protein WBD34_14315 [Burkholderiaceae bacterium]
MLHTSTPTPTRSAAHSVLTFFLLRHEPINRPLPILVGLPIRLPDQRHEISTLPLRGFLRLLQHLLLPPRLLPPSKCPQRLVRIRALAKQLLSRSPVEVQI